MENRCAVVIPVYKQELTVYEQIAFEQCIKILGEHPVIIIKPEGLILPEQIKAHRYMEISFSQEYFKNIQGYNRLMLSSEFYAKFLPFEYILIHQLDAFVFEDRLDYWCDQNFDYIGAPWLRTRVFHSKFKLFKESLRSYFHRRYNIIEKNGLPAIDKQVADQVGNGGFSLRRTKKFHSICIRQKDKIASYIRENSGYFNEDIFFSIEMNRKKKNLKIPGYKRALGFAFETLPEKALQLNHQEMPFGCHAWEKHLDFWRPYFKETGYLI